MTEPKSEREVAGEINEAETADDVPVYELGYVHCRLCATDPNVEEQLYVVVLTIGIGIGCRRHGKVVMFTPEQLKDMMSRPVECDACRAKIPHEHPQSSQALVQGDPRRVDREAN